MSRVVTLILLATSIAPSIDVRAGAPQSRQRDPAWMAPAEASSRRNPLASRPETAAGGRKLFAQRCSSCHGDDGRGSDRAPDLTVADVQAQTDGVLFWKISGGNARTGMPAFSFLPEPQRWQLVMCVRELGRPERRAPSSTALASR